MDDFQPEDELKPDTSDRPAPRGKKPTPSSKLPISKQHLMIAVGILVLLLLVLGIGSALNSSSKPSEETNTQGNERNIDLGGNSSADTQTPPAASQQANENQSTDTSGTAANDTAQNSTADNSGQVAPQTDNQASVASLPVGAATLDRNAKLGNSSSSQTVQQPAAPVQPLAPAHRVATNEQHSKARPTTHTEQRQPTPRSEVRHTITDSRERMTHRQSESSEAKKAPVTSTAVKRVEKQAPVTTASQPVKPVPAPSASPAAASGKGFTVQLSGASREDTLNAWAKQQNLSSYQVYKTSRNGQAWYILTSGNYKTSAEAKNAISALPEAVKAKSPWVKPMSQIRQESAQ